MLAFSPKTTNDIKVDLMGKPGASRVPAPDEPPMEVKLPRIPGYDASS